jgi:hypothetical protein
MPIPEKTFLSIDVIRHDPTAITSLQPELVLLKPGVTLQEEELAICKTDKGDKAWYLVEVHKIYPEEIEVMYYTIPREHLDGYETATHEQRQDKLSQCRFRKTWFIRAGSNAGKGTLNPPFPKSPHLRLWTGKLPTNEFNDLILATGIRLDTNGYLNKESLKIASQVTIPHEAINTIEDEKIYRSNYKSVMLCIPMQSTSCATAGDAARLRRGKPTMKSNATKGMTQPAS